MSTSAVNNAANAAAAAAGAANPNSIVGAAAAANAQAQANLSTNYTQFLTLLTTQLQNQDPTAPADVNQMTSEMIQLSDVQAQLQTNTDLGELLALVTTQINSNAVSYIGKQVDAASSASSPAQTELTNSQATLVYNLPAGVSNANVTITNAAGQTVFSGPGTTASGRNEVQWNGATSTGTTAPDGTYNFTVTAQDSGGNALTATTLTTGIVQSVENQNGTTTLSLGGGLSVPLSNVQEVYNSGTNPGS